MKFLQKTDRLLDPLRKFANFIGAPLLDLSIRGYMAYVFLKSGLIKFGTWQDGDFASTIYLFEEIHPVPGLDPEFAAYAATSAEIILPVLLIIGLFTRFAAAGLLVMTAVIEFLIPAEYGVANTDHYYYMLLLAVPFIHGARALSADALLRYVIWNGKKETYESSISKNNTGAQRA